LDTPSSQEF